MNARRSAKALLALRAIEEDREEAELRKRRQLRQACLDALKASETKKALASCALHEALDSGDRAAAISAELALACGPLEHDRLQRRLAQLDGMVAEAAAAWQTSRIRRLQMETLVETAQTNLRREMQTREQKMLDGWFLSSRQTRSASSSDENSQRQMPHSAEDDGTACAISDHE